MNVHDAALAWYDAGACVLPAAADGSKRPALAWDRFKRERPGRAELENWFTGSYIDGIGIVCGAVSGNLEMFEAEAAAVEAGMVRELLDMLPQELAEKLNGYAERSPKGGVHWIFRVDGVPVKGNTKLARRPARTGENPSGVTVLFETRGEGGWTVIAPSNGNTHPTGKPWQILYGTPGVIPLLTAEEYRLLHTCAAIFDAMPEQFPPRSPGTVFIPPAVHTAEGAPGADFEARATWQEILVPAGWRPVHQRGEVTEWVRPDKSPRDGISATTGWQGDWLYVFTTSTEFESERTYTKFGAYAVLHHGGDFTAAAGALRKAGYGTKPPPPPLQLVHGTAAAAAAVAVPGILAQPSAPGPPPNKRTVVLRDAPTKVRPVTWWWEGRMPVGCLSLLAGREGIGKSVIGYDLAAKLTRGALPGKFYRRPMTVIICATEDSWEHTITPRLLAAGADLSRVKQAEVRVGERNDFFLSLPDDLPSLEAAVRQTGDVALLLLDPLISRLDASLDTHKDADVRQALEPLTKFADTTGVGILGLIHVNKGQSNDPLNAIMASRAFAAVARSVSFCIVDRDDPTCRMLGTPKNNLGRDDLPSLRYILHGCTVAETEEGPVYAPRLSWDGEDSRSVADVMNDNITATGDRSALQEATDWLKWYLGQNGGLQPSKTVKAEAKKAGHSERTIKRAVQDLKINIEYVGRPPSTYWSLPGTQLSSWAKGSGNGPGELGQTPGESVSIGLTTTTETDTGTSDALFVVGPTGGPEDLVGPVGPSSETPRARAREEDSDEP